jgi:hypothetical protein
MDELHWDVPNCKGSTCVLDIIEKGLVNRNVLTWSYTILAFGVKFTKLKNLFWYTKLQEIAKNIKNLGFLKDFMWSGYHGCTNNTCSTSLSWADFSSGHSLQSWKSWWWWIHFVDGGNGKVALMGLLTLLIQFSWFNFCALHYE